MIRRLLTQIFVVLALLAAVYGILQVRSRHRTDFLTAEERYWLGANDQRLTVAPDPRWQPDQSVEDQQIYEGIIADFLELIERKLGIRFMRLYTQSWAQTLEAESRGKIDIHPVLVKSAERTGKWLFTEPYMRIPVIVVMRASLKDRFTTESMQRLRMGIGHGYGIEAFMREQGVSENLIPVESDRFGLIKAAMGEIDLMVTDLASASYYIEKEGLTNLRLAATLGSLYEFSFASRSDQPILNSILNKALEQVSREDRRRIFDRWIVFDVQPFYQSRSFWYTAGVVLLVVAVMLGIVIVWNATLKLEVALKTGALQKARDELERRVEERTEQLAEANQALQQDIAERAMMANDILHISGNERARIGRDLHDSIGQQMVGIAFLCQALESRLLGCAPGEAAAARRISEQTNALIRDMKGIVKGLLPVDVMDKGLVVAIAQLARETQANHGIECRFQCDNEDACRISDNAMATNLYRIVQEATANAVKHAEGVQCITISLDVRDGNGTLEIADDGGGIAEHRFHAGMGLKIMRYRAALAGGSLSVNARERGGTAVVCVFNAAFDLESAPE
jgi:signal transduction histidine kinase/ABC-type amino acid transport substrate-binding protein